MAQTAAEKAAAQDTATRAFVAGRLLGLSLRMEHLDNNMTETHMEESDRKMLRHASHLLYPTNYTEEEFKDES